MKIDFSQCEKEEIHRIGSVQRRGVMLVIDRGSLTVVGASSNVFQLIGRPGSALLGQSLSTQFASEDYERIRGAIDADQLGLSHVLRLRLSTFDGGLVPVLAVLNSAGADFLLLEIEEESSSKPVNALLLDKLDKGLLRDLCAWVLGMSGFDRVMAYLFDEHYNGTVVEEARRPDVASYLHHRFPSHDIPAQARALYLRNGVRVIEDSRALPVPIEALRPANEFDLSLSAYRAVAPVHLEYLQNMGVASSMSLAMICEGRLVGLIACHSLLPRKISLLQRHGLFQMLKSLTARLENLEHDRRVRREEQYSEALSALREKRLAPLRNFFQGDGAVWIGPGGETQSDFADSSAPVPDQESAWKSALSRIPQAEFFFASEFPAHPYPGTLHVPLVGGGRLLVFRKEWIQTILWGGDPYDPDQLPYRGGRIEPRKSFRTFEEQIKGQSRPWSAEDQEFARRLPSALVQAK